MAKVEFHQPHVTVAAVGKITSMLSNKAIHIRRKKNDLFIMAKVISLYTRGIEKNQLLIRDMEGGYLPNSAN